MVNSKWLSGYQLPFWDSNCKKTAKWEPSGCFLPAKCAILSLFNDVSRVGSVFLGLVKKLGFVLAPARTRLARKQNAGLLVGSPSFADTASRSRSQPKMEDNLFTSP